MRAWDELTREEQEAYVLAVDKLDRSLALARRISSLESAISLFLERPGCNPTQRKLAFRRLAWSLNEDGQLEETL